MTIATADIYPLFLTALCAWREARGECVDAQRGVIWTVRNRAAKPGWWGKDTVGVVLQPWQFSSFNAGDANATLFPASGDKIFAELLILAQAPGNDPTGGATSYFDDSIAPPAWATDGSNVPTVKLGRLNFYRLAG